MIGRSISHYEITEKLGEGGMGVVYKARDSRLKRFVALKVLPPEKVTDAERKQRFVQEAQSASALNHPNIVTVYDIGQSEGVDFIAMEYVEGKTLCELIGRKGLKLNEALKYAVQIADALAKAHAAGIVHRDLKPGNVMVTPDGRVKVLDFGLAKLTEAAPASPEDPTLTEQHSTELGMIVGTASYMSPEQAEGKKVDARSDIFSFGSLLYEMLTGRRAFRRDTPALTLVAILHLEPPPLPAEVPGDLNKVMARCLRKDVARRYQHMDDVRFALEELKEESKSGKLAGIPASGRKRARLGLWAAAAAGLLVIGAIGFGFYLKGSGKGAIESIAVLPLDIRSNDADADYISDGITESVNNSLARLPGLKVIPHSVALHYKGKAMDGQKIGGELRVQAVLTGRVAQRGDDLTVNVELDDVRNGKQLWGEQYNRKLADLLAVQDDIAREVSRRLGSPLSAADEQKMAKGSTDNPEAYQLYLKGKYYTNKFTKGGFQKGIDYFNQAIAKDSNYELAYGGLAYNYINQDDWFIRPNEAAPKAREAAKRALAIDESDSDAHLSLAIETHWYEWDWAAAEREFKRAIELNPNNSDAYEYYSWYLASMGRQDEAIAAARQGQQADPLSLLANFGPGSVSVFARHWDRAIEQLRSAIELDPNYWFDHCFLGRAYEQKGQLPQAIAAFQHALDLEKDNAEIWSGLGHAYAASGNRTEAQKVLDHLKELSAHSYVAPYNVAVIYAGLGKKDQTFVWLDQAYKERSYLLAVYLTTDSRLDNLHSDPRFADLRRRIGLPE